VEGFDLSNSIPFCYVCHRVILATGQSDLPNRLGVPGELDKPTWVLHDLRSLEAALDRLVEEEEGDREGKLHASPPLRSYLPSGFLAHGNTPGIDISTVFVKFQRRLLDFIYGLISTQ
jgi:hypothetical protein